MTVINTNVAALVTQSAMSVNGRVVERNMAKLSTGLRINSSADDAAGLAIVSNMTSKILGLDMSVQNANDAISMIQTADGALDGMVNMVQRMRELAVQSSNSTITTEQRGFLNLEFQELKKEIDRSAKSTDWNGKKILNQEQGTNGQYTFQVGTQAGQTIDIDIPNFAVDGSSTRIPLPISTGNIDLTQKYSNILANKGPGFYQINDSWLNSSLLVKYNQIDYKITIPADSTGLVTIAQLNNGTWQTIDTNPYRSDQIFMVVDGLNKIPVVNSNFNVLHITGDTFRITKSNSNSLGENISFQVSRGAGKQSELIQTWSFITPFDQNKSNGAYLTSGDWLGSSLLVNYNQKEYKITLPLTSAGLVSIQKLTNGIWTQVSTTPYEASYQASLGYQTMLVEGLKKITEVNDNFDLNNFVQLGNSNYFWFGIKPSNSNTLGNKLSLSIEPLNGKQPDLSYQPLGSVYTKIEENLKLTGKYNVGDIISINIFDRSFQYTVSDQDILSANQNKSIITNFGLQISNANVQGLNVVTSDTNLVFKSSNNITDLNSQLSIIRNQTPAKAINNATIQINLSTLDTLINSRISIESIDTVLNNISSARSTFGAKINRLTHTIDNLNDISMNLTSSRSRIQDTDYAKAMSDLAKAQIIQQASTAMLAQANSSKQYVLKLLQT